MDVFPAVRGRGVPDHSFFMDSAGCAVRRIPAADTGVSTVFRLAECSVVMGDNGDGKSDIMQTHEVWKPNGGGPWSYHATSFHFHCSKGVSFTSDYFYTFNPMLLILTYSIPEVVLQVIIRKNYYLLILTTTKYYHIVRMNKKILFRILQTVLE